MRTPRWHGRPPSASVPDVLSLRTCEDHLYQGHHIQDIDGLIIGHVCHAGIDARSTEDHLHQGDHIQHVHLVIPGDIPCAACHGAARAITTTDTAFIGGGAAAAHARAVFNGFAAAHARAVQRVAVAVTSTISEAAATAVVTIK